MNKTEKHIIVYSCIAHFLTHFFILIFPALVIPISRDLKLAAHTVIPLSFIMYLLYGVLAIPWGYVSDIFRPRIAMGSGVLLAGAGFILASFSKDIFLLQLAFGIVGVGCSAYHPSGMALLSKGVTNRGKAMGINGMFGNLGIAFAPLTAGLLNYFFGWKTALLILGIMGMLAGVKILFSNFNVDRDQERQESTSVSKNEAIAMFLVFCVIMIFSGTMYRGFTVVLPAFFETKVPSIVASLGKLITLVPLKGDMYSRINTLIASIITSMVFLIGMAGQLVGGKIADSKDLRWSYFIFFSIALPFLVLLYFLTGPTLVLAAGLFSFFALGMQPIENSLLATITPSRWRSVSYGIKFTIVFGGGAGAVKLVGIIQELYGVNTVILTLSFPLVIVLLLILVIIFLSRGRSIRHMH